MNRISIVTMMALTLLVSFAHAQEEEETPLPRGVIIGADGSVIVNGAQGNKVEVGGDGSVHVKGSRGGHVDVDASGVRATPGAPAKPAPPQSVAAGERLIENKQKRRIDCHGGDVAVLGNSNQYTFLHCETVLVAGNQNRVTLGEGSERVEISGNGNTVAADLLTEASVSGNENKLTWLPDADGAEPAVYVTGRNNAIRER